MVTFSFSICSLVFMLIFLITYFSKRRLKNKDNSIYSFLIITNIIGLIIDIIGYITMHNLNLNSFLNIIISKLNLIYYFTWLYLFVIYIIYISKITKNSIFSNISKIKYICYLINISFILILPLYINNEGDKIYSYGPSASYVYFISIIFAIIIIYCLFRNLKKITKKEFIPLILFVILGLIVMLVQMIFPTVLLLLYSESIITAIMFFTIENPDVKMLNELYKNKEIMESNYEDKYNFLFEITQESRNPLKSIENICSNIEEEKDIKVIKENVKDLSNLAKRLDFTINNVMNVSTLDAQKINIIDKKYNLKKVCEELTKRVSLENKKDIEFKYNIPHNDLYLYGDDMKIKQVLYSLIVNSLEKTNVGYVEFKVNVIEKYDYARVIFMVTDSGPGIEIDKINEILSSTGALDKEEVELLNKKEVDVKLCQKVIKLMGGNLMIKSDLGKGSEFILTIDQRVYHDETKSILVGYENVVNNYKKALIVSQDKTLISKVKNILNKNDVSYSVLYYGLDAVDKIKSHKKYDFILISDEMKEVSGLSTLKEMQKVKGFSSPCIVMLNESKKGLAKHYIEDGFSDYIINEDIDSLNKIIQKY
mgnify:FL=1